MEKTSKGKKREALKKATPVIAFLERYVWVIWALLIGVTAFFVFFRLGAQPARDFDEARHGVSAYEMLQNGEGVVNTYGYQNDYYNLKPPISFWAIMGGYKLFGYQLIGLRVYSAVAYLLTAVLAALFAGKRYGKLEMLASAVLFSCAAPFYGYHYARNGDADALFGLFFMIAVLAAMLTRENPKWFPLCGLGFALAFLTKSWHAFLIAAIAGLILLMGRSLTKIPWKQWLLFLAGAILPIAVWAVLRYQADGTEFFRKMVEVDLLHRVSGAVEGHTGGFFFYFKALLTKSWCAGPLFLCLCAYAVCGKRIEGRREGKLWQDIPAYLIWMGVPLVFFTAVPTKIEWYILPAFVPVLLLTALLLCHVARDCPRKILTWGAAALFLLCAAADYRASWRMTIPTYEDSFQIYLSEYAAPLSGVHNQDAYVEIDGIDNPDQWKQRHLLMSELLMNLKCKNGGAEAFGKDGRPGSILITTEEVYSAREELLKGFPVLDRTGGLICIQKPGS